MPSSKREQLTHLAIKNPGYKIEARLLNEVLLDIEAEYERRLSVLEDNMYYALQNVDLPH